MKIVYIILFILAVLIGLTACEKQVIHPSPEKGKYSQEQQAKIGGNEDDEPIIQVTVMENGSPVDGAVVKLYAQESSYSMDTTVTDALGEGVLGADSTGWYFLKVIPSQGSAVTTDDFFASDSISVQVSL